MNQDKYRPRIYQFSPKFYQYQTQQGIIYSNNQNSTSLDSLQGFCRVYFKNGTILDGIFQEGNTNEATYYGNYTKGWLEAKWNSKNRIHDEGYQYTQKGQCIYKGYFFKNTRTGPGQQWFGQDSFKGNWKNGMKEGKFIQKTKNNKLQSQGNYAEDKKVGTWKYYYGDLVHEKVFTCQKQIKSKNNQSVKLQKNVNLFSKQQKQKQKIVSQPLKNIDEQLQIINHQQINNQIQQKRSCCFSWYSLPCLFCCQLCPPIKVNITTQKVPIKVHSMSQNKIMLKEVKQQNHQNSKIINLQSISIKQSVISKNTQLISQQIKYIDPFVISSHKNLMTQTSYENLLDENKMIDDSAIEAWSIILQFYVFNKMNDRVIILPICLMKYYAGRDLKNRNYKYVKHYTKQFNQPFSLLRLYGDNKQKIILIPIIKNIHYILAVIEIRKDQKLKCKIYDSLKFKHGIVKQPSKNIYWSAIRDYLKDYYNQSNSMNVELSKLIDQMQLSFEQCPLQQDNVSCGAFISIFMYYFSINKQNQLKKLSISKERIYRFRTQTFIKILKNNEIDFQEIDNIQKLFVKNISIKK